LRVLLDTCTLVWLAADPGRLSKPAAAAIRDAENLLLSDATVWEIALKWGAGKLGLPEPPRTWIQAQVDAWSLLPVPIQREHLLRSSELADLHRDPFDRLLVAQTMAEGLTLLTPDPAIRAYPVTTLW
jgi:PIN domain nuclease of toxin-antitoxin system